MSDVQNIAARATLRALGARGGAQKTRPCSSRRGLILLVAGYFYRHVRLWRGRRPGQRPLRLGGAGGRAFAVRAGHAGGLPARCWRSMNTLPCPRRRRPFRSMSSALPGALMLAGARMLLPWRWAQALCEAALAAILLYCAVSRLKGADWRRFAPAAGGRAGGVERRGGGWRCWRACLPGFSWSLSMGIAALGFGLDSLWDALGSMQAARGMIRGDINGASPQRGGSAYFLRRRDTPHANRERARDERFRPIALGAEIFLRPLQRLSGRQRRRHRQQLPPDDGHRHLFPLPPLLGLLQAVFTSSAAIRWEFCVFFFTFLAYPLGGTAEFYQKIQGFDKVAHTLSGVFVAMLALTLFSHSAKKSGPLREHSVPTAVLFVFFASMAVAGAVLNCVSGRAAGAHRARSATCIGHWRKRHHAGYARLPDRYSAVLSAHPPLLPRRLRPPHRRGGGLSGKERPVRARRMSLGNDGSKRPVRATNERGAAPT